MALWHCGIVASCQTLPTTTADNTCVVHESRASLLVHVHFSPLAQCPPCAPSSSSPERSSATFTPVLHCYHRTSNCPAYG